MGSSGMGARACFVPLNLLLFLMIKSACQDLLMACRKGRRKVVPLYFFF